jgi:hypothetical protein
MKTMDAPGLSFLPPDAPQSMPALAMQQTPAPYQGDNIALAGLADAPPAAPKASRGRPKKATVGTPQSQDVAPGPIAASVQAGSTPSSPPAPATQVAPAAMSPLPAGLMS